MSLVMIEKKAVREKSRKSQTLTQSGTTLTAASKPVVGANVAHVLQSSATLKAAMGEILWKSVVDSLGRSDIVQTRTVLSLLPLSKRSPSGSNETNRMSAQ
jgi:hypothetical protein